MTRRALSAVSLGAVLLGGIAAAVWPLPGVRALPARVRERLAAHGAPYTPLSDVPRTLRAAIVAAEDERFYANPGIDAVALGRAAVADLEARRVVQGGSTLTEELADVVLVGGDRTPLRRLRTMWLALRIARAYSKAQVLELYLNAVYFGEGAYGVGSASRVYFGRPVRLLDLADSAVLAGLPRAPSVYDPKRHPRLALRRAREVLAAMVDAGAVSRRQAAAAARELAGRLLGGRRPPGRAALRRGHEPSGRRGAR